MIVFKYIEDKDVFQKFYSKMLAKRLVQHLSASDDAEASMISKLKVGYFCKIVRYYKSHLGVLYSLQHSCGFEYTSKLQRMFQDIGVSKDLNELFKKHISQSSDQLDSMLSTCIYFFEFVSNFCLFPLVDFSIQVLSSGSWPFQQTFSFVLPNEVWPLV